ncbi:OVARIAN TUMOR DOMAIN-containing deubiquitinating enzyme 7 [Eucalyptus grandis]|uniref:OVARIAN TUMOR DOMAIN-containing deubiquitinating enzyme 7 n=1 Tax=Eucalyptus grandis TaxID=71139 RepID=UPI00192E9F31|nr:OVARIAN TUMOR DOMAIN-containing deubiquitinating enzyme 7 [Eucalyptus grandis]
MAGSGCENIEKVEQTLLQMYGDVDAAIEYLIAEKGIEDFSEEAVQSPCNADASHGDDASGNSEEQREEPVEEANEENPPSNSAKRTNDDGSAQREDKKIPRNKNCPCGSKKKYKSCCGSGTEKVSAISKKGRKEKKQGKRGSDASAQWI